MRAVIVDDERLARNELRRLLKPHPTIEICGEAANVDEAYQIINDMKPDLIFLDIQLPGRDGFALLEMLESVPQVIFTTAYDEYAVKAFEVNALDYLTKPIDPRRLKIALEKLSQVIANAATKPAARAKLSEDDQVFVRDKDRCWFVKLRDIRLFESEGNYTRLYLSDYTPLVARSLSALEEKLDNRIFFRASRKHIINLQWIKAIHPSAADGLIVTIEGQLEIEMSRRQAILFREIMSL